MKLDPITEHLLENKQDAIHIKIIKENSPEIKDAFKLWKLFIDDDNKYRVKYGLKTIDSDHKSFKDILKHRIIIGAYKDDVLVGIVSVYLGKKFGQVSSLIVEPKFRNKGIGTLLVKSAIDYFKKEGRKEIYLNVWDDNKSAEKLYLKLGFKSVYHDMVKII